MEKINYEPVFKTGVLSSSVYEDGNILTFGENTHLALIEGGNKFAALEVINGKNKNGDPLVLNKQDCEDGKYAVFAISSLKVKRVYSSEELTSNKRLSGGMTVAQILALEAGKEYRLSKTADGFKKPFGWNENEPLVQNYSYRFEPVTVQPQPEPTQPEPSQPTTKK